MSYCDETQAQAHHWVLPVADGPVSIGTCKFCNTTRDHFNYVPGLDWRISPDTTRNRKEQRQLRAARERETVYPDGEQEMLSEVRRERGRYAAKSRWHNEEKTTPSD